MIEQLGGGEANIFHAWLTDDKSELELREACDGYFFKYLTKKEVIELANDFLKLADEMVET